MPPEIHDPNQPLTEVPVATTRYGSRAGTSLSQVKVDRGLLSAGGKRKAIILIAAGLLTFVLPLIHFDPPLQGQKYWSVLDVSNLPEPGAANEKPSGTIDLRKMFNSAMTLPFVWVYVLYGVLVAAGVSVLIAPFRKLVAGIGLTGIALLLVPFRGNLGLMRLLEADSFQSSRGGSLATLWLLFAIEYVLVTAVAWTDTV